MKGLSISGMVLGCTGPFVMALPLILALFAGDDYWQAGWALFFFTVPVGLMLSIAGTALVIVAASLALRRGVRPRSVPVVGISLAGTGLLLLLLAVLLVAYGAGEVGVGVVILGMAASLTGIIMSGVAGLRAPRWR